MGHTVCARQDTCEAILMRAIYILATMNLHIRTYLPNCIHPREGHLPDVINVGQQSEDFAPSPLFANASNEPRVRLAPEDDC